MTARYRNRTAEVEAVQWTGESNCEEVFAFLGLEHPDDEMDHSVIHIDAPGGTATAQHGDWVVRNERGEFGVCTPGLFAAAYEPVSSVGRVPDTSHTVSREQLLDALDFSYCLGLGFETPEQLLAAYDASRTVPHSPADRAAVCICGHTEQQHFEDVCITEITGCDCGDFILPDAAREVIARWREAATQRTADRAAVLREAIDVAREEGHRLEEVSGIKAARGARSVAYLLRRLLVKAQAAVPAAVSGRTDGETGEEARNREPDPDCERCEGSGLDPDAYFVNHDTQTWTHAPCSECFPEEDESPASTDERVKHSGPNTKFCVLCLSGEHERVADAPAVGGAHSCRNCEGIDPDTCLMNPDRPKPVPVHAVPLPGSNGISSCCGRPPCEFVGERVTRNPDEVTCPAAPAVGGAQPKEA